MNSTSINVKYDLMKVGLTEREAKVYQVLVGVDEITASAIPRFTDIPRTKVYEILDSLIAKGFCKEREIHGESMTYYAVDPKIALSNLVLEEEDRLNEMRRVNEQISEILIPIFNRSSLRLKDYDFVETLRSRQEIISRYRQLRDSTTSEMLEFTKAPLAMSEEEIILGAEMTKQMIQNGVKVKAIYELDKHNNIFKFALQKDKEIGVESRFSDNLPVKLSLFDDNYTMIFMQDPLSIESHLTALVINHSGMNTLIKMAFQSYWEQSSTINSHSKNR